MRLFACIHGRKDLTVAFMGHIGWLREQTGLDLPISLCYSESEDFDNIKELIREQDQAFQFKNFPLGDKFNYLAFNMLHSTSDSHFMLLGSDDFASPEYILHAANSKEDFAGIDTLYFYNMHTEKAVKHKYSHPMCKTIGAGRLFSRSVLNKAFTKGNLWDSTLNASLDNNSEKRLWSLGYTPKVWEFEEPQIVDVKSEKNIHLFQEYEGSECVDPEKIYSIMPCIKFQPA